MRDARCADDKLRRSLASVICALVAALTARKNSALLVAADAGAAAFFVATLRFVLRVTVFLATVRFAGLFRDVFFFATAFFTVLVAGFFAVLAAALFAVLAAAFFAGARFATLRLLRTGDFARAAVFALRLVLAISGSPRHQ
jgi:hypothetical protein